MATPDSTLGALPPHDLTVEAAVLGSVLFDDEHIAAARAILAPEDFYAPDHQTVFRERLAIADSGKPCDIVLLANHLQSKGLLERLGGPDFLIEIMKAVPSTVNAVYYSHIVKGYAVRRQMIEACQQVIQGCYDLSSTEDERTALVAKVVGAGAPVEAPFDLDVAVDSTLVEVDAALNPDESGALLTGIEVLDRNTGSMRPGQLWVIGGRPQHVKTATSCNIMSTALKRGDRVLNVRFEERPEDILMRLASLRCGVPYADVRTGAVRDNLHDVERFKGALNALRADLGSNLSILMYPGLAQIEREVQRFGPAILVLDTLQKATHAVGRVSKRHDLEVARLTAWLGRLAGNYGLVAIAVSQIGRAMLRENRRGLPRLEHLKESGAIEEDADVCALCYWPWKEMLLGEDTPAGRLIINLAKNRTGYTGLLACRISPGTQLLAGLTAGDEANFVADVQEASSR